MLAAAEINRTIMNVDSSRLRPKRRPSLHLQSSKVLLCKIRSRELARAVEQLLKTVMP